MGRPAASTARTERLALGAAAVLPARQAAELLARQAAELLARQAAELLGGRWAEATGHHSTAATTSMPAARLGEFEERALAAVERRRRALSNEHNTWRFLVELRDALGVTEPCDVLAFARGLRLSHDMVVRATEDEVARLAADRDEAVKRAEAAEEALSVTSKRRGRCSLTCGRGRRASSAPRTSASCGPRWGRTTARCSPARRRRRPKPRRSWRPPSSALTTTTTRWSSPTATGVCSVPWPRMAGRGAPSTSCSRSGSSTWSSSHG